MFFTRATYAAYCFFYYYYGRCLRHVVAGA